MTTPHHQGFPRAGLLVFIGLCLVWGSTWLAIKVSLESIPPLLGVALRFTLSAACLVLIAILRRDRWPRGVRTHVQLAAVGVLSFCLSYCFVYLGECHISSGLTSILFATFPFFIAIVSHFLLPGERLTWWKMAGVIVGFAGVVVLFQGDLRAGSGSAAGIALVVGGAFASALSNVYGKPILQRLGVIPFTTAGMLYGSAADWAAWLVFERGQPARWTAAGIASTVYLALFGTVATFLGYFWLLQRTDATRLSLFTFITPVVAMAAGGLFLGEELSPWLFSGSALILAGILLTLRRFRRDDGKS